MFKQVLAKNAFQRRNFLHFLDHPSLIRFISTNSITNHNNSFTISYLINSCGLSQQKAISASKKIHFDSSTNPDSVLTLLRNNGFSDSQISKFIAQHPRILVYSVDKTLKPKFDFFNSKGVSGDDLVKVLSREGTVLTSSSLEKVIIPSFDMLKSIVGTDEKVIAILKRSMNVIRIAKTVESNIQILRSHGVPMSNIVKLLVSHPRAFCRNPCWFREKVEEVSKMNFCSSRYTFLVAILVLGQLSRSTLESKFDLYKSWGCSEQEVKCAFRKSPECMMLSKENITSKMNYFVNVLGYSPSSVVVRRVLHFSFERIIPRCAAIQILVKNGKVKPLTTLASFLPISEDLFLKKYIRRFEEEVPEVLRAYQGEAKVNSL